MKIIKLTHKIGIGTKIKVRGKVIGFSNQTIISLSNTGRWHTDEGFYISKDFTIQGDTGIIATWRPLQSFKRYKFRYKR